MLTFPAQMPIDDQMRRNKGVQLCKEVQMKKFHVYRAASALSAVVAVVVASGAASKFF